MTGKKLSQRPDGAAIIMEARSMRSHGLTVNDIASLLRISEHTVTHHTRDIAAPKHKRYAHWDVAPVFQRREAA